MNWAFFTDPVLRAPTLGCMLMCLSSALIGVVIFLRKRSLVGETLSHAAYPGIILAALLSSSEEVLGTTVLVGAFATSLLGLFSLNFLEKKLKAPSDAALCLILSLFFGVGVLLASYLQSTHALLYRKAQFFLYGQAATMVDSHIILYALLTLIILSFITLFYRHLEAINFDPDFSQSLGISAKTLDRLTLILLVLAIVIGMRSVGVVLMSGMLIAPAAAARPFTRTLLGHFTFAAILGLFSAFVGSVLSITLPQGSYSLPTGPMILLVAGSFALLSLLFAPCHGLTFRLLRALRFRLNCQVENELKALWKNPRHLPKKLVLWKLKSKRFIVKTPTGYALTEPGRRRAERIIRLHRLWEVYLVDYLGQKVEKVHHDAEELEHLFTPELERELTLLLKNPQTDPHHQPIPGRSA